jgi:V/A-type H+-transporting ATPase subunit F
MKEILVLTPAASRFGFALAGIRQGEPTTAEIWAALREATADPGIGLIAVDERLLAGLDPLRLRELTTRWGGVLVTLPTPAGAAPPQEDELQRLVRRALGYHVRLEP